MGGMAEVPKRVFGCIRQITFPRLSRHGEPLRPFNLSARCTTVLPAFQMDNLSVSQAIFHLSPPAPTLDLFLPSLAWLAPS